VIDLLAAMDDEKLLGRAFVGPSWSTWRAILKAAFALPMSPVENEAFRLVADRDPPASRVRELWVVAGRRAGKDSIASAIATWFAAFHDYSRSLRPGEKATVMMLACDRDQARICHNYVQAYFDDVELLAPMVTTRTKSALELDNRVEVIVSTNDYRAVRGRAIALAILDECAFYRDESSSSPDVETYRALRPGLATIPGSMLIGISSPHGRSGLLYDKWRKHYGRDGDILVIRAPSRVLNPTLDQAIIDEALEEDPIAAAAEWLAEWRSDVEQFVSHEVVDAATVVGRFELPPVDKVNYHAFVDPSGGSSDSMTVAVAHWDEVRKRAIVDAIREIKPPFSPAAAVKEISDLIKAYRLNRIKGDRYGGEWPRESFREHRVEHYLSPKTKSEMYGEMLPALNSGTIELLDSPRTNSQLCALERRVARGGRDIVDHPVGGHDDCINAVAGALIEALVAQQLQLEFIVPPDCSRPNGGAPAVRPPAPAPHALAKNGQGSWCDRVAGGISGGPVVTTGRAP
jgi:hypothetical protein